MPKIHRRYLQIITIVHGKSELIFCQHIKSNLSIKNEIIGKDKGKSSIQINGLMNFLNSDSRFKTFSGFYKTFPDINVNKKIIKDLKVFIIMDTDDCNEKTKNSFINKSMFKGHFLYDYIVPIYNTPNLENSMRDIGIIVERKKDYIKIFPINGDKKTNIQKLKDMSENLKKNKRTNNLYEYIDYCFEIAETEANK